MSTYPDQDWLKRSNAQNMVLLERQGRTGPGLVPFLGAGISVPFGYDNWGQLLTKASPPGVAAAVKAQLEQKDYEGAAETLLQTLGADGFQNMVAVSAGDDKIKSVDFRAGTGDARARTVSLLPLLANGPIVTTNFDRVLEYAFEANDVKLSVISGPRPDLIVDALHSNRQVLIKLHGDWQDRVGRTFAESDYDANYGSYEAAQSTPQPGQNQGAAGPAGKGGAPPPPKRVLLASAEELLFSSRSMLFIGASLGQDRTVDALKTVHERYAGIRHYAIMAVPKGQKDFDETEARLRDCGILPLWYQAGNAREHLEEVERLVEEIIERISVRPVAGPGRAEGKCEPLAPPEVQPSDAPVPKPASHFDRVVRLIEDGRLTFFLGSAIHHPTYLMARELYEKLAQIFECKNLINDRDAVAQYIVDRHRRKDLDDEISNVIAGTAFVPRNTHELFASWDTYKSQAGVKVPYPLVFTTNYDDILERRLSEAGVPYHLLSYQADGRHHGLFFHQSPDNALRVIERPRNIRELSGGFVLVKLNGGVDCQGRIPVSYTATRLDYWDLAARIADVLPTAVRQKLSLNSILFLGHSLGVPDVESLIRFAHKGHQGQRSWAVVLNSNGPEYWKQCGVEVIDTSVHLYVNELRARLDGKAAGGAPVP